MALLTLRGSGRIALGSLPALLRIRRERLIRPLELNAVAVFIRFWWLCLGVLGPCCLVVLFGSVSQAATGDCPGHGWDSSALPSLVFHWCTEENPQKKR